MQLPKCIIDAVEIFKTGTSQWCRTDPLPTTCEDISLVSVGNSCYALGGYNRLSHLNQVVYASVDDLLRNAIPANQIFQDDSSNTQSAWKALPNTPTYGPAAAVLVGNLFAIGGNEISTGGPGTGPPLTPGSTPVIYLLHELTLPLLNCHHLNFW